MTTREVKVRAVDTLFVINEALKFVIAAGTTDGDVAAGSAGIIVVISELFLSVLSSIRTRVSSTALGNTFVRAVEAPV